MNRGMVGTGSGGEQREQQLEKNKNVCRAGISSSDWNALAKRSVGSRGDIGILVLVLVELRGYISDGDFKPSLDCARISISAVLEGEGQSKTLATKATRLSIRGEN